MKTDLRICNEVKHLSPILTQKDFVKWCIERKTSLSIAAAIFLSAEEVDNDDLLRQAHHFFKSCSPAQHKNIVTRAIHMDAGRGNVNNLIWDNIKVPIGDNDFGHQRMNLYKIQRVKDQYDKRLIHIGRKFHEELNQTTQGRDITTVIITALVIVCMCAMIGIILMESFGY